MTPSQIAELTLLIGWPAVERIFKLIREGDQPITDDQWNALTQRVNRPVETALGPRPSPSEVQAAKEQD